MVLAGLFLKAAQRRLLLPSVSSSQHVFCMHDPASTLPLRLSSSAFPAGGLLPFVFRQNASNTNPPLFVRGLPDTTRSLMVMLEHRNAPIAPRTHWVCWDLPPVQEITVGEQRGKQGRNDFLIDGYTGPLGQSVSGSFCFTVFALRRALHLPEGSSCYQAQRLLTSELLAYGELPFYA